MRYTEERRAWSAPPLPGGPSAKPLRPAIESRHLSIVNHQLSIIHPTGFTLVELLVVIAIVALLMSILMPCLQRVRKQARAVACQANLRQWGIRGAAYAADNDGRLVNQDRYTDMTRWPPGFWDDPWFEALSYDANEPDRYSARGLKGIVLCPMATRIPDPPAPRQIMAMGGTFLAWGYSGKVSAPGFLTDIPRPWYGSYGVNDMINPPSRTEHGKAFLWTSTNDKNAGSAPFMMDSCFWVGDVSEADPPPDCDAVPNREYAACRPTWYFCMNRHDGGTNGLFLDWSVRKVGLKELWTLKWHKKYDTAGPWTKAGGVQPEDWPAWMRRFKDY